MVDARRAISCCCSQTIADSQGNEIALAPGGNRISHSIAAAPRSNPALPNRVALSVSTAGGLLHTVLVATGL